MISINYSLMSFNMKLSSTTVLADQLLYSTYQYTVFEYVCTTVSEYVCIRILYVLYSNMYVLNMYCIRICIVFEYLYVLYSNTCMYCIHSNICMYCNSNMYCILYSNMYIPVQLSYNYCNMCSYSNIFMLSDVREYIIHMI